MSEISNLHAMENDLPPSHVPDDVGWDAPGEAERPRENHWTEREAVAADDVHGRRCIHGRPLNVFCGRCET